MKNKICLILACILAACSLRAQSTHGPKPSPYQLAWQNDEFYLFLHFGPNTYTGLEWGEGDERPEIFDPEQLDCEQWCRIAKKAGAKAMIITAKHHDGFCLWPSNYSTHTVRESRWRNGKGDVLRELSDACKKYGLKFGVYLSPWDRNHPAYGTPEYNDVFVHMLEEIFRNYGPIWELWWDGANGEGPGGKKQVYDFALYESVVRRLSPKTIIFSDVGPDARWCGNETGFAGVTNWNTLDTTGFSPGAGAPPTDTLNQGNHFGEAWIPAECDVSIRPGWFYHRQEDSLVKTPEQLFSIYLKSVGRGANLLLNVPPDPSGRIAAPDSAALMAFWELREKNFAETGAQPATVYFINQGLKTALTGFRSEAYPHGVALADSSQAIEFVLDTPAVINCIVLEEWLQAGQNCAAFSIELSDETQRVRRVINGTTIGHKRILTFPSTPVKYLTMHIQHQKGVTTISKWQVYRIDDRLIQP